MEQKSGLFDFHAGTSSPRGGWNSIQRKISATSYQTHVSNKLDLFQRHAQRGLRRTTVLDTVQSFRRKRYPASFRYESLSCTVTRHSRSASYSSRCFRRWPRSAGPRKPGPCIRTYSSCWRTTWAGETSAATAIPRSRHQTSTARWTRARGSSSLRFQRSVSMLGSPTRTSAIGTVTHRTTPEEDRFRTAAYQNRTAVDATFHAAGRAMGRCDVGPANGSPSWSGIAVPRARKAEETDSVPNILPDGIGACQSGRNDIRSDGDRCFRKESARY